MKIVKLIKKPIKKLLAFSVFENANINSGQIFRYFGTFLIPQL